MGAASEPFPTLEMVERSTPAPAGAIPLTPKKETAAGWSVPRRPSSTYTVVAPFATLINQQRRGHCRRQQQQGADDDGQGDALGGEGAGW